MASIWEELAGALRACPYQVDKVLPTSHIRKRWGPPYRRGKLQGANARRVSRVQTPPLAAQTKVVERQRYHAKRSVSANFQAEFNCKPCETPLIWRHQSQQSSNRQCHRKSVQKIWWFDGEKLQNNGQWNWTIKSTHRPYYQQHVETELGIVSAERPLLFSI